MTGICEICGGPIVPAQSRRWNTWRRFCSRPCAGKHLAQVSSERFTHRDRVRFGKEGAAAKQAGYRMQLLEKVASLDREAAIVKAYQMGRAAAKVARHRADAIG